MTNEQAQTAFTHSIENCRQLLEQLQAHVGNHLDCNPETVHFGHVGDAQRLEGLLHCVCNESGLPVWSVRGQQFKAEE